VRPTQNAEGRKAQRADAKAEPEEVVEEGAGPADDALEALPQWRHATSVELTGLWQLSQILSSTLNTRLLLGCPANLYSPRAAGRGLIRMPIRRAIDDRQRSSTAWTPV